MSDPMTAPCVYCERDVMPPMNIPHADDCPSSTGVFPVRAEDLEPHGMRCTRCHHIFEIGDSYMTVEIEPQTGDDLAGAAVVEVVCIGCAWAADPQGDINGR